MGEEIKKAVIEGKIYEIEELVNAALEHGEAANDILKDMISGMEVVSDLFERRVYYVPETLLSAHAMQRGLDIIRPLLNYDKVEVQGKVLIGTVAGDVHDIGKNLVSMFLEGAGFEVKNLGRDVPTQVFVEETRKYKPDILGLSAMMSTTIVKMREVIEALEEAGLRDDVLVIIGGAAASESYAREIGADGYASDAAKAVKLCEKLMKERGKRELVKEVPRSHAARHA
jgi:5-methyltetrahydrofolate--homocysteine methyltransferase